jgi:hypothetical protein
MKPQQISAEEFDRIFDEGEEDVLQYFDEDSWTRPDMEQEKIAISLPKWMISSLDKEANRIGVNRQAIIKLWLDEKVRILSS